MLQTSKPDQISRNVKQNVQTEQLPGQNTRKLKRNIDSVI